MDFIFLSFYIMRWRSHGGSPPLQPDDWDRSYVASSHWGSGVSASLLNVCPPFPHGPPFWDPILTTAYLATDSWPAVLRSCHPNCTPLAKSCGAATAGHGICANPLGSFFGGRGVVVLFNWKRMHESWKPLDRTRILLKMSMCPPQWYFYATPAPPAQFETDNPQLSPPSQP